MTWFKVDDSFYDHPKIFDAPDCALALWTRAGCWSARNLTDGFVPANLPARLCDDPDTAVRELVARGLWKRTKGGHVFHDWTVYQPTGDEVRDLRQKRADAGRKGGQAKAAKQTPSKSQANASGVAKQNAAPSRPVPTRPRSSLGSVGDSSSVVDAREDDESKIDRRIIELIHEHSGQTVDPHWAARVRRQLLDDREVTNPLAYVSSAIRGEPARYLPPSQDDTSAAVLDMVRSGEVRPDVAKRGADAVRSALPKVRP